MIGIDVFVAGTQVRFGRCLTAAGEQRGESEKHLYQNGESTHQPFILICRRARKLAKFVAFTSNDVTLCGKEGNL